MHNLAGQFHKAGKITAVLCHATCLLLKAKVNGKLLVDGKTWTGFANSEERDADEFVGKRIQPFWIEDEAKKVEGTNFIVAGRFKAHAVRDGNLITGQQQFSSTAVARLVIEASESKRMGIEEEHGPIPDCPGQYCQNEGSA